MKSRIFILNAFLLLNYSLCGQTSDILSYEVGVDLLQLPASTINASCRTNITPFFSIVVNGGYTLNAEKSIQMYKELFAPFSKHEESVDENNIDNQSGRFLQTGIDINFRGSIDQPNYLFLGAYLTDSRLYQRYYYHRNHYYGVYDDNYDDHYLHIYSFTCSFGCHFQIISLFASEIRVNLSFPTNNVKTMYGNQKFIPGMGYKDTSDNVYIFPMLSWKIILPVN